MNSDVAAKKLVAAVRREILRVETAMGETEVDESARMRAVSGAAITSLCAAMTRDCIAHSVNPLRALLDGLLCTIAVEMQESGMTPEVAANGLAQRFLAMWQESARIDAETRKRAH